MKSWIPNAITLSNLFCGCLALLSIFTGHLNFVPLFIGIALFADYFDGLVARLLRVSSELGKQLDSLADMVSFGVVPGAMLFYLLNTATGTVAWQPDEMTSWIGIIGFLVTLFSCLRLAKFNLDDRQSDTFIGLNTPSCTILVLGLLLTVEKDSYGLAVYILEPLFLSGLAIGLSYLLVAEIPMFSFKFKNLKWQENRIRFFFLLYTILVVVLLPLGMALAAIIISYISISLVLWGIGILKNRRKLRKKSDRKWRFMLRGRK